MNKSISCVISSHFSPVEQSLAKQAVCHYSSCDGTWRKEHKILYQQNEHSPKKSLPD